MMYRLLCCNLCCWVDLMIPNRVQRCELVSECLDGIEQACTGQYKARDFLLNDNHDHYLVALQALPILVAEVSSEPIADECKPAKKSSHRPEKPILCLPDRFCLPGAAAPVPTTDT